MSKKFASKENLITFWGKVKALVASNVTTAGTGLSKSGTTMSHQDYGSAGTAGTSSATSGSTLAVPYVTTNAQGHVTAKGTHTHTVTGFAASSHTHAASDITDANKIQFDVRGSSSFNNEYPVLALGQVATNIFGDEGQTLKMYGLVPRLHSQQLTINPYTGFVAANGGLGVYNGELKVGGSGAGQNITLYGELRIYHGSYHVATLNKDGISTYSYGTKTGSATWENIIEAANSIHA